MRSLIWCVPLLLAGCPKGGGPSADPKEVKEVPDEEEAAGDPVKVNVPEDICAAPGYARTVFTLDITYAEGCPVIPSEYDGQIDHFEIEFTGTPPKAVILEPVDLAAKKLDWASAGCGARIHFEGAIGTVDVEFASTGSREAAGTGTWTPAGGAPCDITLAGRYSDYEQVEESDEE